MRSTLSSVFALATIAGPAAAQRDSMTIVFAPHPDLRIHQVFETVGSVRYVGFPELPDTSMGAMSAMVSRTRRVLEPLEGAWVVQVSYDSSRAQYHLGPGSSWTSMQLPRGLLGPYRVFVDSRLTVSTLDGGEDEFEPRAVRGLTGLVDIFLPDEPMTTGRRWTGTVVFPYTAELPGAPPTLIAITLNGRATSVLDSVVPRPADTLAYVSVQAGLTPVTVDGAYVDSTRSFPVTFWGTVSSSMVWSTGWDAWVTGASAIRMHHRVEMGEADPRELTVYADLTARFRIRP
jgi:hypothetical protein